MKGANDGIKARPSFHTSNSDSTTISSFIEDETNAQRLQDRTIMLQILRPIDFIINFELGLYQRRLRFKQPIGFSQPRIFELCVNLVANPF